MQLKPSVQAAEATMLNYILHCLESTLVSIAGGNRMALWSRTVLLVGHQNRDLGTELCQLERAYSDISFNPLISQARFTYKL